MEQAEYKELEAERTEALAKTKAELNRVKKLMDEKLQRVKGLEARIKSFV